MYKLNGKEVMCLATIARRTRNRYLEKNKYTYLEDEIDMLDENIFVAPENVEEEIFNENQIAMYTRVGKIEQLEDYIEEKIENIEDREVVALYIRTNLVNGDEVNTDIYSQRDKLEEFCKKNNIRNRILYIDIRKSGLDKNRKAMNQMISDIKSKKVNGIIVTDIAKLYRNPSEFINLLFKDFMKNVEVTSLDDSVENFKNLLKTIKEIEQKAQEEDEEETI